LFCGSWYRTIGEGDANVVLDNLSLGLIKGSTIDYEKELAREAFVIASNPNATSSCGCNVSFSTD
jgi:iron-sulfur cluster assembly accessory protein